MFDNRPLSHRCQGESSDLLPHLDSRPFDRHSIKSLHRECRMNPVRLVCLLLIGRTALHAQAPRDTARVLDSVAHEVIRIGRAHGESIWPGFRPDTIPLAFTLPTHG